MTLSKTSFIATISASLLLGQTLIGAIYYSTATEGPPSSGSTWNTESDGSGTGVFSGTYASGEHSFILQTGHTQRMTLNSGDSFWNTNASGITLQTGSIFIVNRGPGLTANFAGGDLFVQDNAEIQGNQAAATSTDLAMKVAGTSNIQLGSNTLVFEGKTQGVHQLDLNVVGDSSSRLDLDFSNAAATLYLSNLSSDFQGTIRGDTFNGFLQLAPGDGALNAKLEVGRSDGDRHGKLVLNVGESYSIGRIWFDNIEVADGIYTGAQLVAAYPNAATNISDLGGTLYVGQAVPEPATIAVVFGLLAMFFAIWHRRK
jgi:hypothetical protein